MIVLPNARAHERVREAIDEASRPGGEPYAVEDISLIALDGPGGEPRDLSPGQAGGMENGVWRQTATPITLDATVAGRLDRRLAGSRTRLSVQIEGAAIDQLRGEKTGLLPGTDPHTTDFLTSSSGSLLGGKDAIKLGEFTEYPGNTAQSVVRDVAHRLPYDRALVDIQPAPGVEIRYAGSGESPGFLAHEPAGEPLNRLAADEAVGYSYRDTARNGLVAWIPTPLSRETLSTGRIYASAALPLWNKERPTPPTEHYSHVRAYCTAPSGKLLYEVIEPVPYTDLARLPHAGRTKDIAFDDYSAFGPENARRMVVRVALDLARGICGGALALPAFDPLVERADTFGVAETTRDDSGALWEILWGMRVEAYQHAYGNAGTAELGLLSTTLGYTAVVLVEDRVRVPSLIVPFVSKGLVHTAPPPRDPYGVEGDDLYFDDTLGWVVVQGDDLIFSDTDPAAVTVAGDDIVVSK